MAFVSAQNAIPSPLGTHTGFNERPSPGRAAWPEDPLALEHDALLQRVLVDQGITQADLEAGDAAVGACLEAASKTHITLQEVSSYLASLPQTPYNEATIAAMATPAAGGGSGPIGGEIPQADVSAAQPKRKRPLSAGVAAEAATPEAHHVNGSSQLLVASGGSGASSLATLAESSLEAAAAAHNKGLKHFSLKVCEKVEGKGFTNYNEVADELVADMLAEAAAVGALNGDGGGGGGSSSATDDKNIRRRVYDALNVLEALGIISKTKRDIEWRGWPPALRKTASSERDRLEAERAQLAARVKLKAEATQDVATKAFCLSNLVLRNRDAPFSVLVSAHEVGIMAPNPLALPFMLVHAPESAVVDIDITPDERIARLNFHHHPFQIFDDERVMRMMGLGEPQPELAAAIFGGGGGGGSGGGGVSVRVGEGLIDREGDQLHDHLDVGHTTAFPDIPDYQQQDHQQQQQQQQQAVVDMAADTPLKLYGASAGTVLNLGGAGGVPIMSHTATAVLSPSAAVSAMDLGPDDPKR